MNPLRRLVFIFPAATAIVASFFGFPDVAFVFVGLAAVAGWSADGLLGTAEAERRRRPERVRPPEEPSPEPSQEPMPAERSVVQSPAGALPPPAPAVSASEGSDIFWEAGGVDLASPFEQMVAPVAEALPEARGDDAEADEFDMRLQVQTALVMVWGAIIVVVMLIGIYKGYMAAT